MFVADAVLWRVHTTDACSLHAAVAWIRSVNPALKRYVFTFRLNVFNDRLMSRRAEWYKNCSTWWAHKSESPLSFWGYPVDADRIVIDDRGRTLPKSLASFDGWRSSVSQWARKSDKQSGNLWRYGPEGTISLRWERFVIIRSSRKTSFASVALEVILTRCTI